MSPATILSTYRLQLRGPRADTPGGRSFTFADAERLVPYLARLGVSHIYLSPIMTAPPASAHGYDVVDPTQVNPELGGLEGLRSLANATLAAGMGLIIDIVPNHVGVDVPALNPWWWDVLQFGRESDYESYFDIDWTPDNGAGGRLGLPILGAPGDEKELRITTLPDDFGARAGETVLSYYDSYFPIAPGTCAGLHDDPVAVHAKQSYKLMYWRDGIIGYRRFFSVNGLAGLRQEDPRVFEHTHRILAQLLAEGLIDGVRVDHPDGLADPFAYVRRLRRLIGPERWLLLEKILDSNEPLDPRLDADGTTGYDALRELDGVFINQNAEAELSMLALEHTGSTWDARAIATAEYELKREVARHELGAEIRRLARAIRRDNFSTAGAAVTDRELTDTIIDLVAALPVYRADYLSLSRVTATVVADMARRFPSRRDALDLFAAALLAGGEARVRFSQVAGAVMAKGVEDTTFYRASRLVALQEVGGDPGRFGVSVAEFHLLQQERARLWPRTMTTLTTHDTKRGEDVRARIIELSEKPERLIELVHHVSSLAPAPDDATGYFLLQNILGMWPADGNVTDELRARLHAYAIKAIREAGVHTTWVDPDDGFERAILNWCDALLDGPAASAITECAAALVLPAAVVSLSRKLLQLIGPGIPDVYQGTEFFVDYLVDPDNRRFVDFTAREQALELVLGGDALPRDANWEGLRDPVFADRAKLRIVAESLRVRQEYPEAFVGGGYQAVFAVGTAASHVLGLARSVDEPTPDLQVIALGVAKPLELAGRGGWGDTTVTLPEGTWRDRLTGATWSGSCPAEDLFAALPVALLTKEKA